MTPSLTPSAFFAALVAAAKGAVGKAVIPPAIAFLQAVEAAPSVDTPAGQVAVVAAAGQLQFALISAGATALPAFVQSEQAAISGQLVSELQALQASLSAPVPAAA